MKLLLLLISLSFVSCSTYVKKWHKQMDMDQARAEGAYKMGAKTNKHFDIYRQNKPLNQRLSTLPPVIEPGNKLHSTNEARRLQPQVKRQYIPAEKRRPKASDLTDNGNEGSLWSGNGQANFLFSRNNNKRHGDIVVIEVQSKLKKDISLELARAFPDMMMNKKKAGNKVGDKQPAAGGGTNPQQAQNQNAENDTQVHDRISSVVVEEVSRDHLLVRGRKDVLYKKRKRLVEVQALVARRDVSDEDSVLSSRIIESSVAVLR